MKKKTVKSKVSKIIEQGNKRLEKLTSFEEIYECVLANLANDAKRWRDFVIWWNDGSAYFYSDEVALGVDEKIKELQQEKESRGVI